MTHTVYMRLYRNVIKHVHHNVFVNLNAFGMHYVNKAAIVPDQHMCIIVEVRIDLVHSKTGIQWLDIEQDTKQPSLSVCLGVTQD